jgi:hypothetical protein
VKGVAPEVEAKVLGTAGGVPGTTLQEGAEGQ